MRSSTKYRSNYSNYSLIVDIRTSAFTQKEERINTQVCFLVSPISLLSWYTWNLTTFWFFHQLNFNSISSFFSLMKNVKIRVLTSPISCFPNDFTHEKRVEKKLYMRSRISRPLAQTKYCDCTKKKKNVRCWAVTEPTSRFHAVRMSPKCRSVIKSKGWSDVFEGVLPPHARSVNRTGRIRSSANGSRESVAGILRRPLIYLWGWYRFFLLLVRRHRDRQVEWACVTGGRVVGCSFLLYQPGCSSTR